jgi:DNA-binding protein Fis
VDILQQALDQLSAQNRAEDNKPNGTASAKASTIHALAIAPYPAMADLFQRAALDYPQLDLTIQTGDREDGLRAVLSAFESNYDVVISRGGTARVLEEEVTLPIVEVEVSAIDVLRQIKQACPEGGSVAAVGFESTLHNVNRARDVLPQTVDLYTIEFADEAPLVMETVAQGGYALVLCDNVCFIEARHLHLPAQLLQSGEDSIRQALETAIFHCEHWALTRERSDLLWDLARNQSGRLVIYQRSGGLIFSNLGKDDVALYDFLERHLGDVHSRRLVFRHLGTVYRIKPIHMGKSNANILAYSISVYDASVQAGLAGIDYLNLDEVGEQIDQSFFVKTHALTLLSGNVDEALELGRPVMIAGEVGSGKRQLARLLYLASSRSRLPFVEIDCSLLNRKSTRFLTESYHSPLYATDQTIYLHGIQSLKESALRELLAIALESRLAKRCFLIFSGDLNPDGSTPSSVYTIAEQLKCVILDVPALRTQPEVIHTDTLSYLQSLAQDAGRACPEVTPEAMDLLRSYSWPRNNFQLQKVLDRLFLTSAETGTVDADAVRSTLAREEVRGEGTGSAESFDVMRPLGAIERDIAREVIKRCDDNRTLAAKTLGISRTTLWRMLKEDQAK